MKKVFLLAAVAMAFGLSSCKKDYNCTCTYSSSLLGDSTLVTPFLDAKKSDVEDACSTLETTWKLLDASATCTVDKQ